MLWRKPSVEEIAMSSEIGGYQDELEERKSGDQSQSGISLHQPRQDDDGPIVAGNIYAGTCAWLGCRRRISAMELWVPQLPRSAARLHLLLVHVLKHCTRRQCRR